MHDSKIKAIGFEQLSEQARKEHNFEFVKIDVKKSLEEQGPFDAIVLKVLAQIGKPGDKDAQAILQKFTDYQEKHPEVAFIDPVAAEAGVMNREVISKKLEQLQKRLVSEGTKFECPDYVIITKEEEDYTSQLEAADVQYPVMAKNIVAGGSVESHIMGVIFSEKGLHKFTPPFLVQEYFNHDSVIFKLFIVGDWIYNHRKPSLANLKPDGKDIIFNSQDPWPKEIMDKDIDITDKNKVPDPDQDAVRKVVESCRSEFNLDLLGIDLIRRAETQTLGVIDINFFPGYRGITEFNAKFLSWIARRIKETANNKAK